MPCAEEETQAQKSLGSIPKATHECWGRDVDPSTEAGRWQQSSGGWGGVAAGLGEPHRGATSAEEQR